MAWRPLRRSRFVRARYAELRSCVSAAAAARGRTGGTLPPLEQGLHEETTALVDEALGAEAERARAEGAALTLESALDVAYKETRDPAAD